MKKLSTLNVTSAGDGSTYPKGSAQNPYTDEEFERLLAEGKWKGGYVENIGYIAASVEITGYAVTHYEYKGLDCGDGFLIKNSGAAGSTFNYKINTSISSGLLFVSAVVYNPSGHYDFLATADIFVNDKQLDQIRLSVTSSVLYQGGMGYSYIGDTTINLKKYSGHVVIIINIVGNLYNTSAGHWSISKSQTVYDEYR